MDVKFFKQKLMAFVSGVAVLVSAVPTLAQKKSKPAPAKPRATTIAKPAPQASKPKPVRQPKEDALKPAGPAQPGAPPPSSPPLRKAKPGKAKGTYQLNLVKEAPYLVSLKAEQASLSEIAAEVGRQLKIPVLLSPVMRKQRVTVDFAGVPLEGALPMLAPHPYIDYELSGEPGTQPKPIGLYLHALNEPPPAESAVVKGDSEAILIEGNTEDGVDTEGGKAKVEAQPLKITLTNNLLSVRARQQPLTALLYEIALKVDIPFEMKYESSEVVDVDFNNYTVEQVVRALSPNVRYYQRTDLQSYETRPLRLVLMPPAGSIHQTTRM